MAMESERKSAVAMLEEERSMGGEGVFEFKLRVVVNEVVRYEEQNVELGGGWRVWGISKL
jgi:hypothetical protein